MIKFKCGCGRAYKVPVNRAGQKTQCPACSRRLVVPAPESDALLAGVASLPGSDETVPSAASSPPVPKAEWFYRQEDRQIGPVTFEALKALASTQQLSQTQLVWRAGMPSWVPVASVEGLASAGPPAASAPLTAPSPAAAPPRPRQAAVAFPLPDLSSGGPVLLGIVGVGLLVVAYLVSQKINEEDGRQRAMDQLNYETSRVSQSLTGDPFKSIEYKESKMGDRTPVYVLSIIGALFLGLAVVCWVVGETRAGPRR